jgi:hypothetical protein
MASIFYELFDNLPVVSKRVEIRVLARVCIERIAKQQTSVHHGPERGCITLGGLSIERLQMSPRALGVPHVDE